MNAKEASQQVAEHLSIAFTQNCSRNMSKCTMTTSDVEPSVISSEESVKFG